MGGGRDFGKEYRLVGDLLYMDMYHLEISEVRISVISRSTTLESFSKPPRSFKSLLQSME